MGIFSSTPVADTTEETNEEPIETVDGEQVTNEEVAENVENQISNEGEEPAPLEETKTVDNDGAEISEETEQASEPTEGGEDDVAATKSEPETETIDEAAIGQNHRIGKDGI